MTGPGTTRSSPNYGLHRNFSRFIQVSRRPVPSFDARFFTQFSIIWCILYSRSIFFQHVLVVVEDTHIHTFFRCMDTYIYFLLKKEDDPGLCIWTMPVRRTPTRTGIRPPQPPATSQNFTSPTSAPTKDAYGHFSMSTKTNMVLRKNFKWVWRYFGMSGSITYQTWSIINEGKSLCITCQF